MGGSSSQTIGQRYFAKLTTFIGNPIEKLIGINFDNRGWIFKPDNDESFLRVESPNLYGDKEGGVAGFIDIYTGTADQLPNATYSADFPKVSGYPFQSYLLFRGLGKKPATSGGLGQFTQGSPKHYNNSFYHGNSGYMKEMLLWPQRTRIKNNGIRQWYEVRTDSEIVCEIGTFEIITSEGEKSENIPIFLYTFKNFQGEVAYSDSQGIWGTIGSSALGGDEDPNITEKLYLEPISEELNLFDLVEITATITGSAKHFEHKLYNASDIYKYSIKTTGEENEEKQTIISIVCKKGESGFPYLEVTGTGTIKLPGGTNFFFWTLSSQTKPLNFYNYENKTKGTDINPVHKIREILTDDTAMNKPESDVNDENFKKAANVLFDEKLGISWSVTEKSCIEAINELCGHIEAGVRINRQTGLYEMVLFRDDWFADDEIHTLPVNKIKSMQLEGAVSADELINKLNVSYYNRDAIKNSSFSVAENASIRNLKGHENSEDVKFPYFMNQRNAAVVAQWKLKQMSTPVWQGTFTTGFYQARKWNRYDLLRLEWPRRWNGTILVRIMKINLGTGTDVSIDFVEVVPYSGNLSSNIVNDTPVDTTPKPPLPALFKAFELSYLEAVQLNGQKAVDEALAYNPDAGYAAVIAKRPQDNSLSALMYTDTGNDYERAGAIVYSETAELDQSLSKMDHAFIVKKAGDIDMVSTGTQITVNNEIMVYQSYDEETGLLTVKRGALDTVPQNHVAGSVLYFADDFITVDPTEYVTGEIINVKALTTTPSGILDLDDTEAQQVEIQARAIRPYPPANVKINGEYWGAEYEDSILITWVHRNRVQQTGGEILGFYESGVIAEDGTTYILKIFEIDALNNEAEFLNQNIGFVDNHTINLSTLQSTTKSIRIELTSTRDGFECYQSYKHIMFASFNAPSNLTAAYVGGEIHLGWEFSE